MAILQGATEIQRKQWRAGTQEGAPRHKFAT
jgi:hypothetical protein